jgi:hypothetical protein
MRYFEWFLALLAAVVTLFLVYITAYALIELMSLDADDDDEESYPKIEEFSLEDIQGRSQLFRERTYGISL